MLTFHGGPADGRTLAVTRAPVYLRVVHDALGQVDTLDQLDDEPTDAEQVAVYVRPGEADPIHLCGVGGPRRTHSGWYWMASYVWIADVDGEQLRDRDTWRAWVLEQPKAGTLRMGDTTWPPT